jgi:protein SCO1/2
VSSQPTTRRALLLGSLAASAALVLSACGSSGGSAASASAGDARPSHLAASSAYQGTALQRTFAKPDVTLTDTSGKPYDLAKATAGKAVLLYFGYTHCPDVCPTTMGDIAVAVSKLPKADQQKIAVVFVSTDPARDTPSEMRSWLDSFNPAFVGLTGDINAIIAAAKSVGVFVAAPVKGQEPVHGAQVLAFLPTDDKAHVLYTSGTPSSVFRHDLPLLVKGVAS